MKTKRSKAALTGVITGVRFATKSLEPSLMRRSAIDQGLIMGGSFLTGFIVGSATGTAVNVLPLPGSGSAVRAIGVAATTARSAQQLSEDGTPHPPPIDEREAWAETGAEVLAAMALAGVGSKHTAPVVGVSAGGAFVTATAIEAKAAIDRRQDTPDPKYLAIATGVAAALNGVVAALVGGVLAGALLPRRFFHSSAAKFLASSGGLAVTIAGLFALGRIGVKKALGKIAAGNRATEIEYAEPPDVPTVSGSEYSLAAYETLGLQGRRLVSEVTPVAAIGEIMGTPALKAPVRVYVGLGTAQSEDARVETAIQELRRAGGFERSLIVAASPAGTGYVNYITAEATELMALGDVATVAVQYGEVPSMLSITKVGDAARLYAKVVTRLREEIDETGRDIRLAAYGESLGSITCQIGVLEASASVDDLIVDHALWVGTPQGSKLFAALVERGVPVFDHFDGVEARRASGLADPSVFLLNHDNDPVTKFTPTLAYEMPDWLKTLERGRNVEPNQRWLPGVAFWQALIDTKNAATVIPGEFFSTGHDYRADLAEFVRAAYDFESVDDSQVERIEARLRASEITRAERIAMGKVQRA